MSKLNFASSLVTVIAIAIRLMAVALSLAIYHLVINKMFNLTNAAVAHPMWVIIAVLLSFAVALLSAALVGVRVSTTVFAVTFVSVGIIAFVFVSLLLNQTSGYAGQLITGTQLKFFSTVTIVLSGTPVAFGYLANTKRVFKHIKHSIISSVMYA